MAVFYKYSSFSACVKKTMNQIEPNKKIEDKGVSGAKRPRVGKHVPYVQRGETCILGDPGADKGGEGKCKPAEKYIWNEEK